MLIWWNDVTKNTFISLWWNGKNDMLQRCREYNYKVVKRLYSPSSDVYLLAPSDDGYRYHFLTSSDYAYFVLSWVIYEWFCIILSKEVLPYPGTYPGTIRVSRIVLRKKLFRETVPGNTPRDTLLEKKFTPMFKLTIKQYLQWNRLTIISAL